MTAGKPIEYTGRGYFWLPPLAEISFSKIPPPLVDLVGQAAMCILSYL